MKIYIISDVHLEFSTFSPPDIDADIVILAGDIGISDTGILWAKGVFNIPVIYVPGNHEYYDPTLSMNEHKSLMKSAAKESNVTLLDNNVVTINGVRFIGTTLWTSLNRVDAALCSDESNIVVNFKYSDQSMDVKHLDKPFVQQLFEFNRDWLKAELDKPFSGETVVITHHAPSPKSIHDQWIGHAWNPCFSVNMEELMGDRINLWVHGHTHNNFDYVVDGKTRVVCNPRGYPNYFGGWENPECDPAKVIEI